MEQVGDGSVIHRAIEARLEPGQTAVQIGGSTQRAHAPAADDDGGNGVGHPGEVEHDAAEDHLADHDDQDHQNRRFAAFEDCGHQQSGGAGGKEHKQHGDKNFEVGFKQQMVLRDVHHIDKAKRKDGRLHDFDDQQHKGFAEYHRQQVHPHRGFPEDDVPLLADFPVGVQRSHKGRHGAEDKQRCAAAHVHQVGGEAVGVHHQFDDEHHKRCLQHQTGQQEFIVPDQAQIALYQHRELTQEFHHFAWLHRLSASFAASGQAAARRLNSGVVKYWQRYCSTSSGTRSFSKISLVSSTSK